MAMQPLNMYIYKYNFVYYSSVLKEWALAQQESERADTSFKRGCMFCRMEFHGSRAAYVKHLYEKHNLHLGKPENLVLLDELLDKIESTIERYWH